MDDSAPDPILTPSQLNVMARSVLEDAFPLVSVEGELGNVARPASGHLYFTLKDARAQVRCAMFRPRSARLGFQPREGLKVLARGRLTLYEARGDYQLILDSLEEAGEGALRRAFDQLKARLQAEGLFDRERKRPLPAHVRRLGLVTSPSGAAVRDVLSVIGRRFPLLEVDVLPVPVQGEGAPAQIIAMLQGAAASGRYDALLLTRGGGSLEDLWAFNDEALVRAVAASPVPLVAAIGHETDFSLAEFAADLRAPTPSAAAELLVPDAAELAALLGAQHRRLATLGRHALRQAAQRADRAALRLHALRPEARLEALRQRHRQALHRLRSAFAIQLERRQAALRQAQRALRGQAPQRLLANLAARVHELHPRLHEALPRRLRHEAVRMAGLARALEVVSPLATVARGYAIIQHPDGRVVRRSVDAAPGDVLKARLQDGSLALEVLPPSP